MLLQKPEDIPRNYWIRAQNLIFDENNESLRNPDALIIICRRYDLSRINTLDLPLIINRRDESETLGERSEAYQNFADTVNGRTVKRLKRTGI